jgi:glycosyltransferase involved in cell wall biosynthesis
MPPALRARARMRVVGKPYMDLAPIRSLAARLGVADRLTIEPVFVTDAEIPALFGPGTIAVFPYREIEASGVLALATAYGRPMIAARLGCFAETMTDGEHGHLVEPEDVASLAGALTHMAQDPAFAERCGAAVRLAAQVAPGWDEIAHRTADVYQMALERRAVESRNPIAADRSAGCRAMP